MARIRASSAGECIQDRGEVRILGITFLDLFMGDLREGLRNQGVRFGNTGESVGYDVLLARSVADGEVVALKKLKPSGLPS